MLKVLRELVDAVADLKGISGNQAAELHARLDEAEDAADTGTHAAPAPKPTNPAAKSDAPAAAG